MQKTHEVIHVNHNWTNKKILPFTFIKQLFFLLRHIRSSRCIFVMFGGYWSFLPTLLGKIFRKPVFIILGGTDSVSFPKLHYGSLRKPMLKAFIGRSYKWATELLPVSENLIQSTNLYYQNATFKKQGVKYFFPTLKTNFTTIYNGFDSIQFQSNKKPKIANSFVCIAAVDNQMRFKLKGIDLMLALAHEFPSATFTVIGIHKQVRLTLGDVPDNFIIKDFLPAEEFISILSESEFYMQLSISEGFPNSLGEGMLCECIPIGSNVGAIAEIIGNTGLLIERDELSYMKQEVQFFMQKDAEEKTRLAKEARARIIQNFSLEKREHALIAVINKYQ